MKSIKRLVALALVLVMAVGVMVMPASAAEVEEHTYGTYSMDAGFDAACPTCGEVGTWMYDVEMPSGYWYLNMAVYYCEDCEAVYHFYF